VLTALPDAAYVVRTAWLYGAHGPNFVRTMIRLAAADISPAVVDDQLGQPTWTLDVARQIRARVGANAPPGIYHATSSGENLVRPRHGDLQTLGRPGGCLVHTAWAAAGIPAIGDWRDVLRRTFPTVLAVSQPL
jgi:dTDP-4-dehydrorhamnose reductase